MTPKSLTTRMPYLTAKLQGFGTTIFAEMSALAVATESVNLGQGRDRRDQRWSQSVSTRTRDAGAAQRDRCSPATLLRPHL